MIEYKQINYITDIQEIVALLQGSLSVNHTQQSFLWKHYQNPFGKSHGVLATDQGKIIGVRMFMSWKFCNEQKCIKALRPVDTVVHPGYRKKGIFKSLNLKGLEDCEGTYDLIFNTPNKNSSPGNLKMGWQKYGKDISFRIAYISRFSPGKEISHIPTNQVVCPVDIDAYYFRTDKSNDYIHWRYFHHSYKAVSLQFDTTFLFVIYKITNINGIKVLVINEILGDPTLHQLAINSLCSKLKIFLIYYLNNNSIKIKPIFSLKRNSALILYRDDFTNAVEKTVFSLGDLEGRI